MSEQNTVVAYLQSDGRKDVVGRIGRLTDWYGKVIGTYRITSVWPTPRSYVSHIQCQVDGFIDGVKYTGRSGGSGLSWVGRRTKVQPKFIDGKRTQTA